MEAFGRAALIRPAKAEGSLKTGQEEVAVVLDASGLEAGKSVRAASR